MKFSVLLPTHDRLDLLRYAVESVLRQDYESWEIIISDNDSKDDVEGYVRSLNDKRIKYHRTDEFINVTDNWNNALKQSSGDYVIMLGDDDALMPGYFETVARLIADFEQPELIYTDAYIFAYPGVMPGFPTAILIRGCNGHFTPQPAFVLDTAIAQQLAKISMSLQFCLNFNMQHSLVSRKLIDRMLEQGEFYQSFFPDYYTTMAILLCSRRTVIYPQPIVAIGVSKKSHGFFFFNDRVSEAKSLLHSKLIEQEFDKSQTYLLPDTWQNRGWLSAMYTLARNYGQQLIGIGPSFVIGHYRRKTIIETMKRYYLERNMPDEEYREFYWHLLLWEKFWFDLRVSLYARLPVGSRRRKFVSNLFGIEVLFQPQSSTTILARPIEPVPDLQTILDVVATMPTLFEDERSISTQEN